MMNDSNYATLTELERVIAGRIKDSVCGVSLPPGFSARLAPALAARRRARRFRQIAVSALALAAVVAVAAAIAFSGSCDRNLPDPTPRLLTGAQDPATGAELAAGWTIAGICRTLRRRRRDDDVASAATTLDSPETTTEIQ